jgi:hypothetical protein
VVRRISLTLALLAFGTAGVCQDLGEAAAKEKARRKKLAAAGKSYTGEDLERGRPAPAPTPTPAPASSSPAATAASRGRVRRSGVSAPQAAPREEGAETEGEGQTEPTSVTDTGAEAHWRDRANAARKAIAEAEKALADAQAKYDSTRKGAMTQPLPIDAMRQVPQSPFVKDQELLSAEKNLASAKSALDAARTALSDLEEEARRKGIPPGWLR